MKYERTHVCQGNYDDPADISVIRSAARTDCMSRALSVLCSIIFHGLRHVALPAKVPKKVCIVLEYDETTVRHEFSPNIDELVMRGIDNG